MSNKSYIYIIKGLVLTVIGVVVFLFSQATIWTIDCVTYQYNFATGEKIRNISDIFESQSVHYFVWNGRYVAHWLCQLFLPLLGKTVFAIFNAIFTVMLILLIYKLGKVHRESIMGFFTACVLVLLALDTDYIPPCQIGYVWMGCLTLSVIYLFFEGKDISKRGMFWKIPALLILSLLAGNGQEAINIGFAGAFFIFFMMNVRKLSVYQWILLIGFGVGFLSLCLSPANFNRLEGQDVPITMSLLNFLLNLRITYIFFIVLIYKLFTKAISVRIFYKDYSFFINAFLIDLAFNLFIGIGGNRQLFGMELCSCILTLSLLRDGSFNKVWLAAFGILTIAVYAMKYNEIVKAKDSYSRLCSAVAQREGDRVFADFPEFSFFVHPTPIMRHGVYLDYVLSSIEREQGEDSITPLKTYPTALKSMLADSVKNQYYEYLPNEYVLLQDRHHPKEFIVERKISVLGFSFPLSPYMAQFDQSSKINTEDYCILYLPQISPFILNTSVEIK